MARGGARNSAQRRSWHLTADQCEQLFKAADDAFAAGLPFNRFITVLWQRGGIDPADNAKATGAFTKRAADWLRPHGYRLAWAWVQEASRKNGAHVHILLHVPPALDPLFRALPLRWAKAIMPGRYVAGIVQCQRIAGARTIADNPAYYRANLARKLRYMLKAATPVAGAQYGLVRCNEASEVIGKRLGTWQRRTGKKGQVD